MFVIKHLIDLAFNKEVNSIVLSSKMLKVSSI